MRRKVVAGNFKMNLTPTECRKHILSLSDAVAKSENEVIYFVPAIDIIPAVEAVKGTKAFIGAENMYYEEKGAFTGEISADMLLDAGASYVLIGHSERREIFGEINEDINKKVLKAIEKHIAPLICCGESLLKREKDLTFNYIREQIISALKGVAKADMGSIIIAYEPIWAIGTGKTASPKDAEEVCLFIRKTIEELYDFNTADKVPILYGGSVNASNAAELFATDNIDGGLVGGASLKSEFADIINYDA